MRRCCILPVLFIVLLTLVPVNVGCGRLALNSGEDTVTKAWVGRYDSQFGYDDGGQALAVDGAGSVYVTGYSQGVDTSSDYATVKYDSEGNEIWAVRYDGPASSEDLALDMALDSWGSVYVTGWSQGNGTEVDYATVKYDTDGNQLWVARYDGPINGYDLAHAVAMDYSENIYVTGWSRGNGTKTDYATIKYDSGGNQLWVARYDGPASDYDLAYDIAVDYSGNIYVTGWSQGNGTAADYATVKYDTDGNQLWVAHYDGPMSGEDNAQAIAVDGWGDIYVTGWSQGDGTETDYATVKYDTNGNQLWVERYDGPANGEDKASAMGVDSWGNIYVTGWSQDRGTKADYATVKYDNSGGQLWVERYDGPANGEDNARAIGLDSWGNLYVSGWSQDIGIQYDYATVKYDTDGDQLWVARYDGPVNGHDEAYAMAVDIEGNPFIAGRSSGNGTQYDYTTIKYVQ